MLPLDGIGISNGWSAGESAAGPSGTGAGVAGGVGGCGGCGG